MGLEIRRESGRRRLLSRRVAVGAAIAVAAASGALPAGAAGGLTIDKTVDGKDSATTHAGDTVTYRVVVSNGGDVPVRLTSFSDVASSAEGEVESVPPECAALVGDTIVAGGSVSCTYSGAPTVDTVNTATVAGRQRGGETVGPVSDDATVDVVNPAITIVKTANPPWVVGDRGTTTFTYVVTNTGDVALTDIVVTDDVLGEIGRIATLAPGESATLNRDATVTIDRLINTGTVTGVDPLGRTVTDDDDASVDFILGSVVERPVPTPPAAAPQVAPPPAPEARPAAPGPRAPALARTGPETGRLAAAGFALLAAGLLLVGRGSRRRPSMTLRGRR